jgi:hypothetical protein
MIFVLNLSTAYADALDDSKTITRQSEPALFKRIYQMFGESASFLVSTEKADFYLTLSSNGTIAGFYNLADKTLGGWEINSYSDITIMSGEIPQSATILHAEGVYSSPYWKVTDPSLPQTGKDVVHREKHTKPVTTHGCLDVNPLRYGDIDGDGQKELVVTKNGDFIVSSTSKKAVIFAANWFMNDDIVINNDPGTVLPIITPEERAAQPKDTPQYGAYSNLLKYMEGKSYPAWRSFAKLYFGDFDADKAPDIVMWRKLYESNLMGNPQKGFSKKAELWVHYKLVNGEYKKQPTDSATVKTWLTTKNLTWQKGYPSKSECKGQENQLIPEMHDPLLNDADVLK